jgi:hypothetical protein
MESLANDFVFIVRVAMGINSAGAGDKMQRIAQILTEVGPSNIGSANLGSNTAAGLIPKQIVDGAPRCTGLNAVFYGREKAREALRRLKEADVGLSVTVSGLIGEVFSIGREVGLEPHTVNLSLGVHGRTELLPEATVLDLTTMCGHAMVSANLARKSLADASHPATIRESCRRMGAVCTCGIFSLERGEELLREKFL